jgi:hypothetical protein
MEDSVALENINVIWKSCKLQTTYYLRNGMYDDDIY